jgi:hypothetical protein
VFANTIDKIIDVFVEAQIKTDICINNMAVSSNGEDIFKLFIDPSAEFHTLNQQLS